MNKKGLALIAAALLLVTAMAVAGEGGPEVEKNFSAKDASVGNVLIQLVKRLPALWSVRREARKVAATLPDYRGEVETADSDRIYSWIEDVCKNPNRRPGTDYDHQAEQYIRDQFIQFGLQDVKMDPVDITVWSADIWSLTVSGREVPSFFVVNTGFTPPEGVTAPMVYVGLGSAEDMDKLDVKGKIVVADVPFPKLPSGLLLKTMRSSFFVSDPDHDINIRSSQYLNFVRQNFTGQSTEETAPPTDVYWNSVKRGAAAVLLILRDQPSGSDTHYGPYDGIMKPMPGLWIGKYDGEALREQARQGETATVRLTGGMKPGVMHNVWGVLPGQSDEVILVTSHHDSPFKGASEDGAGTAQVLAQAWTWSRVPIEGRPKTMVFVVDGGHFYGSLGAHEFARTHMDLMKKVKILITLEHLGAKEVEEKDKQYAETGKLALTVMFTSPDPKVVGALMKAMKKEPAPITASIPSDFFGGAPTSDASGYVIEAGVPVISWIGCPYYLLDSHDTLDKIDRGALGRIARTVTEIVKVYQTMD